MVSVAKGVGSVMRMNEVRLPGLRWTPGKHKTVNSKQKKNMQR